MPSLVESYAGDTQRLKVRIKGRDAQLVSRWPALFQDEHATQQVQAVLSDWGALSQARKDQSFALASFYRILRWLGFQAEAATQPTRIGREGTPNFWTHWRVEAAIDSPLPRFGSHAQGRHDVVLAWGELDGGLIGQWLVSNQKLTKDAPVTVLCFQSIGLEARRRLVQVLRKHRRVALVVDPCLVLWLSQFAAPERNRALFSVGLAGAPENPYSPEAAGSVPKEMFFGRQNAVDDLWRIDGPCIVYGGRQLGKSALLQQVVRKYHDVAADRYALYDGAKYSTDLWELLKRLLIRHNLLPKQTASSPRAIQSAIEVMIRDNPQRRVVVLLDECDPLLDQEAKQKFEQINGVRDLMTVTGRRFKVVLTGLHSVQRFQRLPNQPLAHFGEPICVGPLKPVDAKNLITEPLGVLGYRFVSDDLVHRILGLTNCHPSLVQLFCRELVGKMLERTSEGSSANPPYEINEETIAQIHRDVNLGKKMRDRFEWTLDLDPRYRLLGYTFALLEHEDGLEAGKGARAREILDWAQMSWPAAFEPVNTNEDEVVGLLDEMVGLGVLAGSPALGYRLRSPNVLRLIGGADEVKRELDRFSGRPYKPQREPSNLRRKLSLPSCPASPLTLEQEGRIVSRSRGVDLVVGSNALGLDQLGAVLEDLIRPREDGLLDFVVLRDHRSPGEVRERLRELWRTRGGEGLVALVTPGRMPERPYLETINETADWVCHRLTAESRHIKVVFPLGPEEVFEARKSGVLGRMEATEGVRIHRLRRWKEVGLEQWFDDAQLPPEPPSLPADLIEKTSGWSYLLYPELVALRDRAELTESDRAARRQGLIGQLGLSAQSGAARILSIVKGYGQYELSGDDLFDVVAEEAGLSRREMEDAIEYLRDLDVVVAGEREEKRGRYAFEPLAVAALSLL